MKNESFDRSGFSVVVLADPKLRHWAVEGWRGWMTQTSWEVASVCIRNHSALSVALVIPAIQFSGVITTEDGKPPDVLGLNNKITF